eukprot:jgi/Bigna1/78772/fgenesh1_pg.57_\
MLQRPLPVPDANLGRAHSKRELLPGLATARMVNLLLDLNKVSVFASEIFQGLTEETKSVTGRLNNVQKRVEALGKCLDSAVEEAEDRKTQVRFNPTSEFNTINLRSNLFTPATRPGCVQRRYERAQKIPPLETLDSHNTKGSCADGSCCPCSFATTAVVNRIKVYGPFKYLDDAVTCRYSNPKFLEDWWIEKQKQEIQKEKQAKKKRKKDKKNRRQKGLAGDIKATTNYDRSSNQQQQNVAIRKASEAPRPSPSQPAAREEQPNDIDIDIQPSSDPTPPPPQPPLPPEDASYPQPPVPPDVPSIPPPPGVPDSAASDANLPPPPPEMPQPPLPDGGGTQNGMSPPRPRQSQVSRLYRPLPPVLAASHRPQ